jgi:hypothetical protein
MTRHRCSSRAPRCRVPAPPSATRRPAPHATQRRRLPRPPLRISRPRAAGAAMRGPHGSPRWLTRLRSACGGYRSSGIHARAPRCAREAGLYTHTRTDSRSPAPLRARRCRGLRGLAPAVDRQHVRCCVRVFAPMGAPAVKRAWRIAPVALLAAVGLGGLYLWLFLVAAGLCRHAAGVKLERPQRRASRRGRGRTSLMLASGGR